MPIRAVGFDVDGTLYPEGQMYLRSFPLLLHTPRLIYHYGRARKILRNASLTGEDVEQGFRTRQAAAVLQSMGSMHVDPASIEGVQERIRNQIYGRWEQLYRTIKPFRGVRQAWLELRNMGLKTGLLSDFPLGNKPEALGIADISDAFCCSEETGYLKPDGKPFLYLAETLGFDPEEILYVGNSYEKDIIGARAAGMKTALIVSPTFHAERRYPLADIIFRRYGELPSLLTSTVM